MQSKLAGVGAWVRKFIKPSPRPEDVELGQAGLRLQVEAIVLVYLVVSFSFNDFSRHEVETMFYLVGCLVLAAIMYLHVLKVAGRHVWRRLVACVMDATAITLFMHRGDETAAVMFPLYLWVTLGYGFRYNARYLLFSQAMSILGFALLCRYNEFWMAQDYKAVFFVTLITIPIYAITLIKRLTEAAIKAQEASAEKSRFVSNMSHEIRTPLHGIIGIGELLSLRKYDEEYKSLCDGLTRSASVLLRLVNDVLDISKIESGKLEITTRPFDLHDLMEDTTKIFANQAADKKIAVKLEIDPAVGKYWIGDTQHIQQVLVNLIGNAIKFTHAGHVFIHVTVVEAGESSTTLRFTVKDSGIGIPKEFIGKIFERFSQASNSASGHHKGTGLGTTIAKQLVEAMGGNIHVRSEESVGSTFWFDLPLQPTPAETVRPRGESGLGALINEGERKERRAKLRVLVAEDNRTNQMIIEKILEKSGFQFDLVSEGEEALDALLETDYHIALLDMQMPNLSGLQVCKSYRMINPTNDKLDFMMLSANVEHQDKEEAKKLGFSEFLAKPIETGRLISVLDRKADELFGQEVAVATAGKPGEAEAANDADAIVDETILTELSKVCGDRAFLNEVINSFNIELGKGANAIENDLRNARYAALKTRAHAIRGAAANVGAAAIVHLARTMEKMNHADLEQKAPAMLADIRRLRGESVELLEKLLEKICSQDKEKLES